MRSRSRAWERRSLLQARSAGEIIELTERLYRALFRRTAKEAGWTFALLFVATAFFGAVVLPNVFTTRSPNDNMAQAGELTVAILGSVLIAAPMLAIAAAYLTGISATLASQLILGDDTDVSAARERASKRLWVIARVIGASLLRLALLPAITGSFLAASAFASSQGGPFALTFSVISIGLFFISALMVPLLLVRLSLSPLISALEDVPAKDVRLRNRALMRGQWGHSSGLGSVFALAGVCLVLGLLAWGGFALGVSIVQLLADPLIQQLPNLARRAVEGCLSLLAPTLALIFVLPYWSFGLTVIYFDRRVRLEGFDVTTLQEDILRGSSRPNIVA
jgi:hypothetical protein